MRKTALAALVAAMASGSGAASALQLDPSPDAQGRAVVNAVFRDYIGQRVGVQVETAVVDVERDGVAEIVARFVHSGSCREKAGQCRTVLIRYDDFAKKWVIIIDRPADKVDLASAKVPGAFGEITVDGSRWRWNGKSYAPQPGSLGAPVAFSPVPRETAGALSAAFGQGATKLAAAGTPGVSFEFARPKLASQGDYLLVRMTGDVACGDVAGCPVRLLEKDGASWKPVLSGSTLGDVEVSTASRGGKNDIVLKTEKGFAVMGWSGNSYGIADTVEATVMPKK